MSNFTEKRKSGFIPMRVLVAFAVVLFLGGYALLRHQQYPLNLDVPLRFDQGFVICEPGETSVCTKDIRWMCSPDGKERKGVPSGCSCGEQDVEGFEARGWKECTDPSADTSTWKTYRNEEYGFEFKYPPSLHWQVIVLDNNDTYKVLVTNNESKSRISIYPIRADPGESIFDSQKSLMSQPVLFADKAAKMYTCPEPSPCLFGGRFVKAIRLTDVPRGWQNQNDIKIEVWDGIDEQAQNMQRDLEGILATFKFIN